MLLVVVPQSDAAEGLKPKDVLSRIVSAADMPPGYTTAVPISAHADPPTAELKYYNRVSPSSKAYVRIELKRMESPRAAAAWYEYLLGKGKGFFSSDVLVISPHIGLGEKSIHNANSSPIPQGQDSKYISQKVTVIWQEWVISADVVHYFRFNHEARQAERDFTDHEAGQYLRSLTGKILPRFLKAAQQGSTDDFTSEMAEMEQEGKELPTVTSVMTKA